MIPSKGEQYLRNNSFIKIGLLLLMTILFIVSALAPMSFGYNVRTTDEEMMVEDYNFDRCLYPESYDCYSVDEIYDYGPTYDLESGINYVNIDSEKVVNSEETAQLLNGPMDSPWPMYCHDTRHTGRSPYNTVDIWDRIWQFQTRGSVEGGPIIDKNGVIYVGAYSLYAVYPNCTQKWEYDVYGWIVSCPAIDENGTIYVGTMGNYFYAINSNGTVKWEYPTSQIYSSPVIADDGSIVFGDSENNKIKALYPNGTLKWSFQTNHIVYSSPAIGNDGTVYCGSHDTYLYALYPNNGTLKWRYKTGDWIRTSPCIADDGTIYVVSLDSCLYALCSNGTLRWKTDVGAGTSPTIGHDGTIYAGYKILHAIYPNNGSVKWTFDVGGTMRGGTPCNSIDGIIYLGTHIGSFDDGEIIAIYPDGSLKFRKRIKTVESPPAIGEDGTVYIGSFGGDTKGYLHAFGKGKLEADADGPYFGLINEPVQFNGSATGGYTPYQWLWNFGDDHTSEEQNPLHAYTSSGNYTVTLTVTDNSSNTSSDTTWAWIQTSNDPPNRPTITGETNGNVGESYDYTFTAVDPDESIIWYYIEWGDNSNSGWVGPYNNGQTITRSHTWSAKGIYNISCKAKDPYDDEGPWGYLEVEMPVNLQNSQMQSSSQQSKSSMLLFQILEKIMNHFPFGC